MASPARELRLLSPEELAKDAESFDFFSTIPLTGWLRTAKTLQSQIVSCEKQGDLSRAYMLATRHATLVLQKLSDYPKTERDKYKPEMKQAIQQVSINLRKLEIWKPVIQTQYERELQALRVRKAAAIRREQENIHSEDDHDLLPDRREYLDEMKHRHVVGQLAEAALRQRQSSLPPSSGRNDDLSTMLQQTRRLAEGHGSTSRKETTASSSYHYPAIASRHTSDWSSSPPSPPRSQGLSSPPSVPRKVALPIRSSPVAPPLPDKQHESPRSEFKIKAWTEGGESLRTVFLPSTLQAQFLNLADPNTSRDLETCGVLCASLVSNSLMITHLVIPDQTSTSDTCDTTEGGDNALFDFCDERELIVCGWIHTHPSQTCFLSSRDLHTSAAYQLMLPEAIAIVCSPRHNPSSGIFRLTSPPGLPAVLKCQTKGLFHSHDEKNLYTDAASPGHVVTNASMPLEVVDLRLK